MDKNNNDQHLILKKRLNTFKTPKGSITGVPDDLIIDIIKAWERWTGTSRSLCQSLGVKDKQLANIIKKGKRLLKDGKRKLGPFVPVEIKSSDSPHEGDNKTPIILRWDKKKTIRFYQVDHLVEFLKKAA